MNNTHSKRTTQHTVGKGPGSRVLPPIAIFCAMYGLASAQTFDSGSDGSDGALNLTTPGTILFDPVDFTPPLDPDGDGVYHFTSITIGENVIVRLSAVPLGTRPVTWLATGVVQIDGTLDLDGEDGHQPGAAPVVAIGGAGGYEGGVGQLVSTLAATVGSGPGRGRINVSGVNVFGRGGSASHVVNGAFNDTNRTYGNNYLLPLIGGSGGGGGSLFLDSLGGGGGAGGGAILIASSNSIVVDGLITANGGDGFCENSNFACGGSGSGGAIRLMAPAISGLGTIANRGGFQVNPGPVLVGPLGSIGRTRLEAFSISLPITADAGSVRAISSGPGNVFPSGTSPSLRVVTVAGVAVPLNPIGTFNPADLTIDSAGAAVLEIEASGIPLGTVVNLRLYNETEGVLETTSSPLAGSVASSTATASIDIPPGFSRFTVDASWAP